MQVKKVIPGVTPWNSAGFMLSMSLILTFWHFNCFTCLDHALYMPSNHCKSVLKWFPTCLLIFRKKKSNISSSLEGSCMFSVYMVLRKKLFQWEYFSQNVPNTNVLD